MMAFITPRRIRRARQSAGFLATVPTLIAFVVLACGGLATQVSAAEGDAAVTGVSADEHGVAGTAAVSLSPAPTPQREDYPTIGTSSRGIVWVVAQMHLFFGALVLAVPIFVLVIEIIGFRTGDDRYDDMAHEFMKVSLTAIS